MKRKIDFSNIDHNMRMIPKGVIPRRPTGMLRADFNYPIGVNKMLQTHGEFYCQIHLYE